MTLKTIWNPSTYVIGNEAVPYTGGQFTVTSGSGAMMRLRNPSGAAWACNFIDVLVSSSSGAYLHGEVLNATMPSGLVTTRAPVQADSQTQYMTGSSGSAPWAPLIDDDSSAGHASYIYNSGITLPFYYGRPNAGTLAAAGRVRRIGQHLWTGCQTGYSFDIDMALLVGGADYPYWRITAVGPGWPNNSYVAWTAQNPATGRPWTITEAAAMDDSTDYGVGAAAVGTVDPVGAWRIQDITLLMEHYATNNQIAASPATLVPASSSPQWVRLSFDTGTLPVDTDYYLHFWCSSGTVTIPYLLWTNTPTGDRHQVLSTQLDLNSDTVGGNGIVTTTTDYGTGHIPFAMGQDNLLTVTGGSWSSNVITFTHAGANLAAGSIFTVTGASPSGYNGTYESTGASATATTVAKTSNPGTWSSGGVVDHYEPISWTSAELDTVTLTASSGAHDVTFTTPAGKALTQLRILLRWESPTQAPDAPLVVRVGTAAAGGGTQRDRGTVATNDPQVSGARWTLTTVALTGYTSSAETVYINLSTNASSGRGWQYGVLDSRSDGATSTLTATEVQMLGWTGNQASNGNDQAVTAGGARYDAAILAVVAPAAPAGLTATVVAAREVQRP